MIHNYIAQLNGFKRQRRMVPLGTGEIALYFVLLEYCNELGWMDWFCAAAGVLQGHSGLSVSAFKRARAGLCQKGYVEYRPAGGRLAGRYRLVPLDTPPPQSPCAAQPPPAAAAKAGPQPIPQTGPGAGPLSKQNHTKPKREAPPSPFAPPSREEVAAYCKSRGKGVNPARFWDFYQSKGWLVGSAPMRDWRAGVRRWEEGGAPATGGGYNGTAVMGPAPTGRNVLADTVEYTPHPRRKTG